MTFAITDSSQYRIDEVILVTKEGKYDISSIFTELNIFDSLLMPVMSGNIVIADAVNLSGKFLFDGSEILLIHIKKDEKSDMHSFKKAFRVYKQTNRTNVTPGTVKYLLHFVSDELFYSDQQRINQSYEATYSDVTKKIFLDYLKIPDNNLKGIYEDSFGIRKIIIPNLRPLEAIQWCAKRAVDSRGSPNFIFFQNKTGYNFATLSTLLTQPAIAAIQHQIKNIEITNAIQEMDGARHLEILTLNDIIDKTRSGVNAGKFIGFDPITRTIHEENFSYGSHFGYMNHGNKTPNFTFIQNRDGVENFDTYDSRKVLSIFGQKRQLSEYIKKNDPTSISKVENTEQWFFQRQAIIKNLMAKRLKIVMPGNFNLSSGFNVDVVPPPNFIESTDKSIDGKYIIIASRQIIGFDKHETVIEVASSSSTLGFIPKSTQEQKEAILEY